MKRLIFIIHIRTGFFKTVPHMLVLTQDKLLIIRLSDTQYREFAANMQKGGGALEGCIGQTCPIPGGICLATGSILSVRLMCRDIYSQISGQTQIEIRTSDAKYCGSIDKTFNIIDIAKQLKLLLGDKTG